MRFVHISDSNIGLYDERATETEKYYQDRANAAFRSLLDVINERQVDLLLVAGNLFGHVPSKKELDWLDTQLMALKNTRTIMVAGSKDYMDENSPAATYMFRSNTAILPAGEMSNAYLEDINTCVTGMSYSSESCVSDILSSMKPQHQGVINILLAHGGDSNHMPIDYKKLAGAGFDYVALGYMHKSRHMIKNKMAYSGALVPWDHTENHKHGYIYGEADEMGVRIGFQTVHSVDFVNVVVPVKANYGGEAVVEFLDERLSEFGTEGIYRIELQGETMENPSPDYSQLKAKYHISEIVDRTMPEYDLTKLYTDNSSNLLGRYIESFNKNKDSIAGKALVYGVEALISTGEK